MFENIETLLEDTDSGEIYDLKAIDSLILEDTQNYFEHRFNLIFKKPVLSVEEQSHKGILLYPNPFKDEIHFVGEKQYNRIEVFNTLGKLVKIADGSMLQSINLADLSSGAYLIKVSNNNEVVATFLTQKH